jgi:hypothetical protein
MRANLTAGVGSNAIPTIVTVEIKTFNKNAKHCGDSSDAGG